MNQTGPGNVVEVRDLTVALDGGRTIVDKVSFSIRPGEILGLVGQSGSGKTTVSMSLLGYARHGAAVTGGIVTVGGAEVTSLTAEERRTMRGRVVSYVPQDPRASLNPSLTVWRQLAEVLDSSGEPASKAEKLAAVRAALDDVGLPHDREFLNRYPHQLSGGQLQRVGIAMGIVARPPAIVFDEPTTGQDVTTQRRILDLVRRLCSEHGIAGLYVTHDLAVVADLADRILVMNEGLVVEEGDVDTVFTRPKAAYTQRLIAAAPDLHTGAEAATAASEQEPAATGPVLQVRDLAAGYRRHQALHSVSFDLNQGECFAIVGASGSGKSTLARALIGLHPTHSGEVRWRGRQMPRHATRRSRETVRDIQYIFQSPYNALNPHMTIEENVGFAYRQAFGRDRPARAKAVREALERVSLPSTILQLLPNRLSGGERQRVAIARALVTRPSILICDEITSSLDVIVQSAVIDLLSELRNEGLAMLFVTHNLALVRSFADRVLVIDSGLVVETGPTDQVVSRPEHTYTRKLLSDALSIKAALDQRRTYALAAGRDAL